MPKHGPVVMSPSYRGSSTSEHLHGIPSRKHPPLPRTPPAPDPTKMSHLCFIQDNPVPVHMVESPARVSGAPTALPAPTRLRPLGSRSSYRCCCCCSSGTTAGDQRGRGVTPSSKGVILASAVIVVITLIIIFLVVIIVIEEGDGRVGGTLDIY